MSVGTLPYSDELLARVAAADEAVPLMATHLPPGSTAQHLAAELLKRNVGLVDTARTTFLVDARVHEGVLFRLAHLRRQHPSHLVVKAETWRGLPT